MRRRCALWRAILLVVLLAVSLTASGHAQEPLPKPMELPGVEGAGPWTGSNLILVASRNLLDAAMARSNESTDPIEDYFEGNYISGMSHTRSRLSVELIPNEERAHLNLVIRGVTHGRTVSRSSQFPVTLHLQGVVTFESRKPVFIEESGVTWWPAKTCARARSELLCVETALKHKTVDDLLKQFAQQRYYQSKAKAEQHQAERAEERINQRTDEQTEEQLSRLHQQLMERLDSLRTGGLTWALLTTKTTPLALRAAFVAAEAEGTGAKGPPPETPWPVDLSLRVHQGVLNQVFRNRYGNKEYTDDELVKELGSAFGRSRPAEPKKEPAEPAMPRDRFALRFAASNPIIVEAKNNTVTLTLNAAKFFRLDEKGEKSGAGYDDIVITVKYEVQMTTTGPRLKRGEDDLVVTGKKVPATVKAAIVQGMEDLFRPEREVPPVTLPGNMARVGELKATHARAEAGWLTVGYER